MEQSATRWQVGADIGGTFTDVIAIGTDGRVLPRKVLSTPGHFHDGVVDGTLRCLEDAGAEPSDVARMLHATTVATNAILERDGALTGLVTTRGMRDVVELGRLRRPTLYDLRWQKPEPLAARRHRWELDQRIAADGSELRTVDDDDLLAVARSAQDAGVSALAVALLNSYLRPDVERAVADRLRELLPDVFITASVDVSPEMQEFERTSTALVNSYVGPVVRDYVGALRGGLIDEGIAAPFSIMQSHGGLGDADGAIARPVQIIESGPAAGVIAVQKLARLMKLDSVVAFDMGGTTAKASLVEDGAAFVAADYEVGGGMNVTRGLGKGAGHTVRVPSIDIAEVGAGGGSIVTTDVAGGLHVGPSSAGSRPGPAAYGLGGSRPTLTDANVVLGYLSPVALAGGAVPIHRDRAVTALEEIASAVGTGLENAARGAYRVAVSNMTKAVKAVTSERGRDPRDSTMVAFGGAGPLYAAELARELGIATVVVPMHTGVFSSLGLLVADDEVELVAPMRHDVTHDSIQAELDALERRARDEIGDRDGLEIERLVDMRYRAQRFEIRVPLAAGAVTADALDESRRRFHAEHLRTYGRRGDDDLVELVNLRVRAVVPSSTALADVLALSGEEAETPSHRECWFDGSVRTPVLRRRDLGAEPVQGPLIIEDMDATTLVPPGASAHRDAHNNIIIRTRELTA